MSDMSRTDQSPRRRSIGRRLKEAIRRDRRISAEPLDVSVREDRVVVEGAVQSHRRKLAALNLAEKAARPFRVEDRIRVDPAAATDDRTIAEAVCDRLRQENTVTHETIDVRVRNARVRLSGTVGTDAERLKAENLALGVPGVRLVRNLLAVDAEVQRRDADRSRRLEAGLRDALGPASGAIRVIVSGPRVVLRGHVPAGWYRDRAAGLLRLDGAHRVRNRLEVRAGS